MLVAGMPLGKDRSPVSDLSAVSDNSSEVSLDCLAALDAGDSSYDKPLI